ncbi:serine/threonine-protein kinase [Gemmatimonas groenlandica]|nr:serine/threonine-protein kinase [Gemmatimonas groenlandica]
MSLPSASREAFVHATYGDDATFRAELLALIACADTAPDFLRALATDVVHPAFGAATSEADSEVQRIVAERAIHPDTVAEAAAAQSPPAQSSAHASLVGRSVRHFEVRSLLGTGGMGVVYLARDTMLGRDVALKFLAPGQFTDAAARRRLIREAQAASALDDVHVCAVHAIEETDDGGLCLVMNYCRGGTLRDRVRAGPLPVADSIAIARQLASGLASAHRAGIVHRDLKPANVGFADGEVAKILDFGVVVRAGADDATFSAGSAAAAGTLPYMAPEVLRGAVADARADVWALGVILHEMLTGRRPFSGSSEAAVLYSIIDHEPAPIVREDGESIPLPLVNLIIDMLAKSPAERPANGAEVLSRLESLDGPSVQTTPRSNAHVPSIPMVRPSALQRFSRIAFGLAATAFIAFVVWTLGRSRTTSPITAPLEVARIVGPLPSIAVLPFAVRGGNELQYLREGMVDLLTPAFDATALVRGVDPNSSIGASRSIGAAAIDSATARTLAIQLGAQRYVVGSVVRAGEGLTVRATLHHADGRDVARAQVSVARFDRLFAGVESLVRQLLAAELQAPGDTVAGLAATMTASSQALRAYLDGERELRDARPASAVALFSRAIREDSLFALAWYRLARAARWSEVDSLQALAVRRAFDLSASLPLRLQQIVRGYHALRVGSPLEAERQFRQIVSDYPTDVDAWMLLGETLFENNQFLGRATTDATVPFRKVMTLDGRNREVTVYLMELAARAGHRGELDTLFQMYFSPNSAGEQPGIRRTYLALHARRMGLGDRAIDDPVSALIALRRAGSDPSDLRAARRFATVLVSPTNPSAMRVEGLFALATLDWSSGNTEAAGERWREAALIDADATLLHRALMMISPAVSVHPDSLRAVRRLLESTRAPATSMRELSREEHSSLRLYLVGMLGRQLGDTAGLARAQQQLSTLVGAGRLAKPLASALRGHLAMARGEPAQALAAFERSAVAIPSDIRALAPALGQQADRLARSDALRALGQTAAAGQWYASLRDGPGLWNSPYLATVAERLTVSGK